MLMRPVYVCGGYVRRQSGVVLIVALVMLIAMTLAGLALVRSVDTANIIAGNLSFQQAATHSGDRGVEAAIAWVENNSGLLNNDSPASGYAANGLTAAPARLAAETWDAYWTRVWALRAVPMAVDLVTGNAVSYVIDRLCALAGAPALANCAVSPVVGTVEGDGLTIEKKPPPSSLVYYRITARILGPRNTLSYVQAIIAK